MRTLAKFGRSFVAVLGLVLEVGCGGAQSQVLGSPARPFDKPVLTVTVSPNPVPFSGQPITTGSCVGNSNTWFYNEVFTETGGVLVNLTSYQQQFGPGAGVTVMLTPPPSNPFAYTVPANGSLSLPWPTCLKDSTGAMVQRAYSGTDFNGQPVSVTGPIVVLAGK